MEHKKIIEIIKIVLEWFDDKKNQERFIFYKNGLCDTSRGLVYNHKLNITEKLIFDEYIMACTNIRWLNNLFIFKPGNIEPRIDYLNELLKKLEA